MSDYFKPASERKVTDRLVNSIWGPTKSGKTTHVIGSKRAGLGHYPTPIFYFNYDLSLDELLHDAAVDLDDLYVIDLVADDINLSASKAAKLLDRSEQAVREAQTIIKAAGQGTIVTDTMTHHWNLVQKVMLDEIKRVREAQNQRVMAMDYGDANARFANFVNVLKGTPGANLVFIHHARDVWDRSGPTGAIQPHDNNQMDQLVQTQIQLTVREDPQPKRQPIVSYGAVIRFCRNNPLLRGLSYPSGLDYATLYQLIYERESPYVVAGTEE